MNTKALIVIILILFVATTNQAQTEKSNYKHAVERYTYYYNNSMPDSIFAIFSTDMQLALPIEKTREFVEGFTQQLGSIESTEFVMYESVFAVYKAKFNQGVLAMNLSLDEESKINGLFFKPYVLDNLPTPGRNQTKMNLPFNSEWYVFWGGDTKEENYHVVVKSQKNAFDFLIKNAQGKSYKTGGKTNDDYYCFEEKLIAPCDAEVVLVVDGVKDNLPGEMNPTFPTGNTVVLRTANNEYIYLCHFKQHSIVVKEGQNIKQNDLLGLCGNSGNSSEAHLHFHIQNVEQMDVATGVKCYFEKLFVNGETKTDYSPVKGQLVSKQP
jgi:murein DD-endopeptidase MepM/ murein hydrolase activator NlpD